MYLTLTASRMQSLHLGTQLVSHSSQLKVLAGSLRCNSSVFSCNESLACSHLVTIGNSDIVINMSPIAKKKSVGSNDQKVSLQVQHHRSATINIFGHDCFRNNICHSSHKSLSHSVCKLKSAKQSASQSASQ